MGPTASGKTGVALELARHFPVEIVSVDSALVYRRMDIATAERLDPNDAQRIQRAMEIFYLTGRPMSELIAAGRSASLPYRMIPIALIPGDRAALHQRIAARFEEMLELGLINEVRALREDYDIEP